MQIFKGASNYDRKVRDHDEKKAPSFVTKAVKLFFRLWTVKPLKCVFNRRTVKPLKYLL